MWYHHDQLGSTRLVTNSTGVSQATYTFDAYGGLASSTGSVTNPFLFCGQYQDAESGIYYLRARYYDPVTGQFIQLDPALAATRQPFGYAAGNPLNLGDPTGLDFWGGLQNSLIAVGRALPPPQRAAYVSTLSNAGTVIGAFAAGNTQGVCVNFTARVWAIGGVANFCAVVSYDANGNPKGFGTTETFGGGGGAGAGFGALITYQRSNAQDIRDLGGLFVYACGSAGAGPSIGGGGATGLANGHVVAVSDVGVGAGGGAQAGVGGSWTFTQTWFGS
jgi:RHS repeat-associated protein